MITNSFQYTSEPDHTYQNGRPVRLELTPYRIHSPVLCPLELRPPSSPQRAAQGSNLPPPALEAGVPPLALPARTILIHGGLRLQCVGRDSNPRRLIEPTGLQPAAFAALPPTLLFTALFPPRPVRRERAGVRVFTVSVEGFEPSTPCARGIPARRDYQTALHADLYSARTISAGCMALDHEPKLTRNRRNAPPDSDLISSQTHVMIDYL